MIGRLPESGETWYEDSNIPGAGDGTVPTLSALGPFDDFTNGRLVLDLINDPGGAEVDHGGLVFQLDAQKAIVDRVASGTVDDNQVSQSLKLNNAQAIVHSIALGMLDEKDLVVTLLEDVGRLLDDFTSLEALNQELPILGQSVMDVLPFATTFRNAVTTARNAVSDAAPLADLEEALEDAFGFDDGSGPPVDSQEIDIRFENGQLAFDFAYRPSASTTASFNPGDIFQSAIDLQLGVGLNFEASIGIDLTDTDAGQDMVFVQLHDLTATATVDDSDLNLALDIAGVGQAGITSGAVHLEASVTAELVDPNADGLLNLTELLDGLKNLPEFVDVTAVGTIDATLPLDVTIADFNLADYGQPVVTVSGDDLLHTAPQVGVDIQISTDLRDQILGVLQDLDDKLGPALAGLEDVLATELPVIGTSVGELLGVSDATTLFKLHDIAEPYLTDGTYDYAATFPTLRGLLDALNNAMSGAGAGGFDINNPDAHDGDFAGLDLSGLDLRRLRLPRRRSARRYSLGGRPGGRGSARCRSARRNWTRPTYATPAWIGRTWPEPVWPGPLSSERLWPAQDRHLRGHRDQLQ